MNSMRIRKGDKVVVIAGKDKGKEGVVLRAIPTRQRVVVEGCGMVKKAVRPTQQNHQGGITRVEAPIHVSNVMLVCPKTGKPTRIGIRRDENGKRIRVSKAGNCDID